MNDDTANSTAPARSPLRVLIAGGGVAALECALALADIAGERVRATLLAPDDEFFYRPLTVREPFARGPVRRYPLARIAHDAGAELIQDSLERVEAPAQVAHTREGRALPYDALVLALGALARPHYKHALTIDDRRMDELLHGLIQDIEGGYVRRLAFVSPGRMAWPLPLYELALMTAGRAYDTSSELAVTIVTPEDGPLAIFGERVSSEVGRLLEGAGIEVLSSAYAEVPRAGLVSISPGERTLEVDRIVALPELYGPQVRGVPLGEHGFIRVDSHGQVPHAGPIYAAGDATSFTVKHGGVASQQADTVAQAIAALAGAAVEPRPFAPVIHGVLFTDERPRYLTARITGGHGFASEISDTPDPEAHPAKIASRYLAPYLEGLDRQADGEPEAPARR
jgi:sulfide:quinone oxidoreductase